MLNSNVGDIIDLPDFTDDQLESKWMKTNLNVDPHGESEKSSLNPAVLNEFQSPKVSHLSKIKQKQYNIIFQTFKDVLAKDKHWVGEFKPFKVKLPTDLNISCYKK